MKNDRILRFSLVAALTMPAWSTVARAQSPPPAPASTPSAAFAAADDSRPATTTFLGDTGFFAGIAASRLRTSSYGEDDPEHANPHEDTRRLNRRVALVVRLQP